MIIICLSYSHIQGLLSHSIQAVNGDLEEQENIEEERGASSISRSGKSKMLLTEKLNLVAAAMASWVVFACSTKPTVNRAEQANPRNKFIRRRSGSPPLLQSKQQLGVYANSSPQAARLIKSPPSSHYLNGWSSLAQ